MSLSTVPVGLVNVTVEPGFCVSSLNDRKAGEATLVPAPPRVTPHSQHAAASTATIGGTWLRRGVARWKGRHRHVEPRMRVEQGRARDIIPARQEGATEQPVSV